MENRTPTLPLFIMILVIIYLGYLVFSSSFFSPVPYIPRSLTSANCDLTQKSVSNVYDWHKSDSSKKGKSDTLYEIWWQGSPKTVAFQIV